MTEDNRRRNLKLELKRGQESWLAAANLRQAGLNADAVSRAYYAMVHSARAVLLTEGLEARTHTGIATLLNLHFVRPGRLPSSAPRALTQLQGEREAADDDASTIYAENDIKDIFSRAHEFCEACRTLLAGEGWLDE
ncbi:MAG: HEPN domain-containing protein [Vulcanimicrobiota bacterium]